MASRVGCVGCATMVDDVDVRVAVVAVVVVVTSTSQYELLLLLLLLLGCCAAFSGVQYVKTRSNMYIQRCNKCSLCTNIYLDVRRLHRNATHCWI
jgi:hypothetical protein